MAFVSVIMPVFNAERFLAQSLDSLLAQTAQEWECICVDDGSTDGSARILRDYSTRDSRIRVITQENCGSVVARKRAVAAARGDWALFLDPDDFLSCDAIATLAAVVGKEDVDAVQFGVNVIDTIERRAEDHKRMVEYFNAQPGKRDCGELYRAIYLEHTLSWNLIGRMLRMSVAREAFARQSDAYCINETDLYALFYIVACMKRPLRIIEQHLYNYRCGTGISTKPEMSLDEFKRLMGKFDALDSLDALGELQGDAYNARESIRSQMLGATFYAAAGRLDNPEDVPKALGILLERVSPEALLMALAERYPAAPALVARLCANIPQLHDCCKTQCEAKSASLYADALEIAGQRFQIPPFATKDNATLKERIEKIIELVRRFGIGEIHSRDVGTLDVIWDLLACRLACGIRFFIHHPLCTASLWTAPAASVFTNEAAVFRLASGVIVATPLDDAAMRAEGVNAILQDSQQPQTQGVSFEHKLSESSACVLWLGRFSVDKHPGDAIRIFARLYRKFGDKVRFVMAGSGDEVFERGLRRQAKDAGLGDSIEFAGSVADIKPYLERASVLLATSDCETFPDEASGALRAGLRGVTYCQPQITEWRNCRNVEEVPHRDIAAAARAVERAIVGEAVPVVADAALAPGDSLAGYIQLVKRGLANLHERRTAQVKAIVVKRDAAVAKASSLEKEICKLDGLVKERDATIRERDATIRERDATIRGRDTTIRERDAAIRERDGKLQVQLVEINRLNQLATHPPLKTCFREVLRRIANALRGRFKS